MKQLTISLWFSLMTLPLGAKTLILSPHETIYIDVPAHARVEVSRSDVVSVKDLTTQLMVRAKKRGSCTIKVQEEVFHIKVVSADSAQGFRRVSPGQYRGLTLSPEKDGVLVRGRLGRISDYKELTQTLGESWVFKAKVPEDLQGSFGHFIEEQLKAFGRSPVPVRFQPHPVVILPAGKLAAYRPVLRQLGLTHSMSDTLFSELKSMPATVVFVEIDQKALQNFGVQFPGSSPFQALPSLKSPEEVMAQLDHLAGRGLARRYAEPKLHLTSGKTSRFVSGGELPIRSTGFSSSRVEWKSYGLILELKPKFNTEGQLDLQILLELSGLDPAAGADGIPGVRKKVYETHVFTETLTPILIGNFFELQGSVQTSELPFLSRVPLLGELFKSRSYLEQKSHGYILFLPNF